MNWIAELLQNSILFCSVTAWFATQAIKYLVNGYKTKEWALRYLFGPGGMPSAHSAAVTALSCSVGFQLGFSSPFFAACAVFAAIVMYDAAGVRRETGKQSSVINMILHATPPINSDMDNPEMREKMGHSPVEVLAGCALGIVCSIIFFIL